MLMRLKQLA